jgi:hypothetical protein
MKKSYCTLMKKQRSKFQKGTRTRTTTTTCCTSKKTKLPKAKQLRKGGDKKKEKERLGKHWLNVFRSINWDRSLNSWLLKRQKKPNGRTKKYNDNCLHKIWGPKKRCEEEEEEDAHSEWLSRTTQRNSFYTFYSVNEGYIEGPFTRAFWWSPKWLAYRKTPSNIG